jgi:hypothetical protein
MNDCAQRVLSGFGVGATLGASIGDRSSLSGALRCRPSANKVH